MESPKIDAHKWRISKACQECRVRKIRCDGAVPCQRCKIRGVECVYRQKARNRARQSPAHPPGAAKPRDDEAELADSRHARRAAAEGGGHASEGGSRSIHNQSVAATHRASPSMFLQLYYGPSSNFSLLNSIYHQLEGTRPAPGPQKEVEEMGPGLDLFGIRRLYFGDLADNGESARTTGDSAPMFLDRALTSRLLERYLATYWHVLPVRSPDEYRRRLVRLYDPPTASSDDPDTIVLLLAMALGASTLGEEQVAHFLFQRARQWSARLDEMVNVQAVHIALLMVERARPNSAFLTTGVAVRKAVAAGLHKDVTGAAQSGEDVQLRRTTIWSLFFWEIWLCFSLGRPSSVPESEISVPMPDEDRLLYSLVTLARIMSKCVSLIYKKRHESLLPIWNAANEIRRELHDFAEQQRKDMNLGLVGAPSSGELGVCQVIVSTMYHHTLLLTFRPFLVLRAKLRQDATSESPAAPTPPPWLGTACEYCLDAARHCLGFLSAASKHNVLVREIIYHGFFIEGASHVLAFDLLQDVAAGRRNLPWIRSAIRTLRLMKPSSRDKVSTQVTDVIVNVERMVCSVIPDFRADESTSQNSDDAAAPPATDGFLPAAVSNGSLAAFSYPPVPSWVGSAAPLLAPLSLSAANIEEPLADLTAADMGWDIDFSTMDMEAFLSIDPAMSNGSY